MNSRALIECAVKGGVRHFIFSSTAAVYGNPARVPVTEDDAAAPMSPYGSSKLMTEIMLRDAGAAHGLKHVILRYFNVAGADPQLRTGQSTKGATHLIKVAVETALGLRPKMDVFGTDYPTLRRHLHARLHPCHRPRAARISTRCAICARAASAVTLNCGYGRGYSVREVIDTVKRVSGVDFRSTISGPPCRRPGADRRASDRIRAVLGWKPQRDDLTRSSAHALAWERKLMPRTLTPQSHPTLRAGCISA